MNLRWRLFTKYLTLIVGLVTLALVASGLVSLNRKGSGLVKRKESGLVK